MADQQYSAQIDAEISEDSLKRMEQAIVRALDSAQKPVLDRMNKLMAVFSKRIAADLQTAVDKQNALADATKRYAKFTTDGDKATVAFTAEIINLTDAVESQIAAINKAASENRNASQQIQRDKVSERIKLDRERQIDLQNLREAGKRGAIEAQRAGNLQLVAAREAAQQRVQITRFALETIGRLEKGFVSIATGLVRTTGSILSRGAATVASLVTRQNRDFTTNLSSSLTRRERILSESFTRQEKTLRESVTRQQRIINQLQTKSSSGVLGAATGRGVGGGFLGPLAAGIGIAGLLTSGLTRFSDLERINLQFRALTGNIETANELLAQARDFAKRTPFDLVGVADLAKGFLAIGTAAKDVIPSVETIADAVAFTGGTTENLDRIQRAIGQIVSIGKLQGDELNQLAENLPGINIVQLLANELTGGDTAKLMEMKEAGELSADQFLTAFINGLQKDQRIDGAAEDLASTLSGRIANLKESFSDFGASLIGLVAGPLKTAVGQTQTVLANLATFINGDGLSSGLELLRTGLLGVATGMGAVVAARGAVEVVSLLGKVAGLALTPFGALIVTAGALGGALRIMTDRSEPLRRALGDIRDRFEALGAAISAKAEPILARVASFLTKTVVPALDAAADWIGNHLVGALDRTASFITGTAVPAVLSFGRGVAGVVVPAAQDAVRWLTEMFDVVRDKATAALKIVMPYIEPAISGFRSLGSAIADAFSGDFSNLGAGAGRAAGGIVASLSSIAGRIGEILAPYARQVIDFLANAFSGPNLRKIASGFLNLVEEVGRILGSVASDPRLIAALAAIAAAAAVIALRFAKGFAEGVISNLPDLLRPVPGLIADVLFDPDALIPVLLGAFALTKVLPAFKAIFTRAGEAGASGIVDGLKRGPGRGFDFISTLFGGSESAFRTSSRRMFQSVTDEVTALQNRLRIVGSTTIVDPTNVQAAAKELKQLEGALTPVQLAALQTRDRLSGISQAAFAVRFAAGGALDGLKTVALGLSEALLSPFAPFSNGNAASQVRNGLKTIGASFTAAGADLRRIAVEQYGSVGQAMGAALVKGVTVAMAGLGGFVAGKAEGAAGGSGVISALSAGLTGLAVGGPLVGAAAAGMSLIGASIGKAEERARRLRQETSSLAAAIVDELGDRAKNAVIDLSDAFAALDDRGVARILGPEAAQTLAQAGVTLADLQAAAQGAGGDFRKFAGLLAQSAPNLGKLGYGDAAPLLSKLNELFKVLGGSVAEAQAQVALFGETTSNQASSGGGIEKFLALFDTAPIEEFNGVLKSSANAVSDAAFRPTALDTINTALDTAKTRADAAYTALQKLLVPTDTGLQATIDQQILNVAGIGAQIATAQGQGTTSGDAQARQLARQFSDALGLGLQAGIEAGFTDPNALAFITGGILNAALEGVTDPALRQQITDQWNTAIANATPQIDEAAAATNAAEYNQKFQEFLDNNPVVATFRPEIAADVFDALNQDTESVGENVVDGIVRGIASAKWKAITAAWGLADEIVRTSKSRLLISSPSKVFIEIGQFIGEGLAIGLDDSTAGVGSVVSKAIDDAIARATSAADRGRSALAAVGASLFGMATGSGADISFGAGGLEVGNALGSITTSQQRFVEQFTTTVEAVFAAARKQLEGKDPLTASEQALIGANPLSLGTGNVIGVNNRAAFLDVLDSIASFGDQLLAQGEPLGAVIEQVKTYRDALVQQAASLGFNTDELYALVDAIGLSDSALGSLNATVAAAAESMTAAAAAAAQQASAAAAAESAAAQFSVSRRIAQAQIDYALAVGRSGAQIAAMLQAMGFSSDLISEVAGASGDQLQSILFRALGISTNTVLTSNQGDYLAGAIGNAASAYFDQNGNPTSLFGPQNLQDFLESIVMPILAPYEPSQQVLDALANVDGIGDLMDLLQEFLGVDMPDFIDAATDVVNAVDAYIAQINRDIPVYNPTPNTGGVVQSNTFHLYLPSGDPAANALSVANRLALVSAPPR